MSSSNIILSSLKGITSDVETFYRDYWLPTAADSPARQQTDQRREFIIKKLLGNVAFGSSILELGVGGEGGIIAALRDSAKVHGIDVSDSAISACRSIGIPVSKVNCDNQLLPFEDGSFDAVIALEVFEHFANPQFALEQVRRVLKPQGLLIVSLPSVYTYHWPRLFYPDLFTQTNFKDFLLANRFMPTLYEDPLLSNVYSAHPALPTIDKSFSSYWQASKLDERDLPKLHEAGKELFARRDQHGIRIRPIEALELFKQCMNLGPVTLELETDYLCALFYRAINGDKKEFLERLGSIIKGLGASKDNASYARSLLAIHHEVEQTGKSLLDAGLMDMLLSITKTDEQL